MEGAQIHRGKHPDILVISGMKEIELNDDYYNHGDTVVCCQSQPHLVSNVHPAGNVSVH
jgi:hypothetical protein